MENFKLYALALVCSFILSFALTPVMRFIARRLGIEDRPGHPVKTHKRTTPYLGGLAIYAAFAAAMILVRFFTQFPTGTLRSLRGILLGSSLMALLGLLDDIRPLGFRLKFLLQTLIAALLIVFGIRIQFIAPTYWGDILTLFWVIGVTNALNIIDIMDGLSAGVAAIAAMAFLLIALPTEMIFVNFAAAALAGACLGFLPHNFAPARIFMGDAGSLFIGYLLAALSLGVEYTSVNNIALYVPILILGVPIYDTAFVMILRLRQGKSMFVGSKDHFALRLEAIGLGRKQIVMLSYMASGLLGLCAFIITQVAFWPAMAIYALALAIALFLGKRLSLVKM